MCTFLAFFPARYLGYLVETHIFETADANFLIVGHTHKAIDQIFFISGQGLRGVADGIVHSFEDYSRIVEGSLASLSYMFDPEVKLVDHVRDFNQFICDAVDPRLVGYGKHEESGSAVHQFRFQIIDGKARMFYKLDGSDGAAGHYRPSPKQVGDPMGVGVGAGVVLKVERGLRPREWDVTSEAGGVQSTTVMMSDGIEIFPGDPPNLESSLRECALKGEDNHRQWTAMSSLVGKMQRKGQFTGHGRSLAWNMEYLRRWKPGPDKTPPPLVLAMTRIERASFPLPPARGGPVVIAAAAAAAAVVVPVALVDPIQHAGNTAAQAAVAARRREEMKIENEQTVPIPENAHVVCIFENDEASSANVAAANMKGVPVCVFKLGKQDEGVDTTDPQALLKGIWWLPSSRNDQTKLYDGPWQEWQIKGAGGGHVKWRDTILRSQVLLVPSTAGLGANGILLKSKAFSKKTFQALTRITKMDVKIKEFSQRKS